MTSFSTWRGLSLTLVAIAAPYAMILYVVTNVFGGDVAGVVGPVLALPLSVILFRLETLTSAEREATVAERRHSTICYFLTLTLAIIGLQFLFSLLAVMILIWYFGERVVEIPELIGDDPSLTTLASFVAINALAYFIGGVLCAKTAIGVRYAHASLSSLTVFAINVGFPMAIVFLVSGEIAMSLPLFLPFGLFALLYMLMALVGTRLGSRRPIPRFGTV